MGNGSLLDIWISFPFIHPWMFILWFPSYNSLIASLPFGSSLVLVLISKFGLVLLLAEVLWLNSTSVLLFGLTLHYRIFTVVFYLFGVHTGLNLFMLAIF